MDDKSIVFQKIDGKIICGKKTYTQYLMRHVRLKATSLRMGFSYFNQFGKLDAQGQLAEIGFPRDAVLIRDRHFDQKAAHQGVYIQASAILEQDTLSVIGVSELATKTLELTLQELKEDSSEFTQFAWKSTFFYFPHDWEIGNEESWSLTVYCPTAVFREFAIEIENGRSPELTMAIDSDLWAEEHDRHMPLSGNIAWYLAPDKDGRSDRKPESGHGVLTSLAWTSSRPKEVAAADDSDGKQVTSTTNIRELVNALYGIGFAIFLLAMTIYWRH